jgi:hypothetical protein
MIVIAVTDEEAEKFVFAVFFQMRRPLGQGQYFILADQRKPGGCFNGNIELVAEHSFDLYQVTAGHREIENPVLETLGTDVSAVGQEPGRPVQRETADVAPFLVLPAPAAVGTVIVLELPASAENFTVTGGAYGKFAVTRTAHLVLV